MIEISGWVSLMPAAEEEDFVDFHESIRGVEQLLKPLEMLNQWFEIKGFNGFYTLYIGLNHNHDNGYSQDVHQLLVRISEIAGGSYGLVYIRNHEHETDYNRFRVLKLARGKVSEETDPFLSPCDPIIDNNE